LVGPYLLGVDVGTLGSKGLITDTGGNVLGEHFLEHPVIHPKPGWAEHDPEKHWWQDFVVIARAVLEKSGIDPHDIAGIGVSGLVLDLTPLDKDGRPVRNAILYSDNRAVEEISYINRLFGITLDSENPSPKLLWMKKNEPESFAKTRMVGLHAHNYVVYRLTGKYSTDYALAAGFGGVFDIQKLGWSEDACNQLGFPPDIFPPVYPPSEVIGGVTEEAARETGLARDTPVIVGAADTSMSILGAGLVERGDAMVYYGTAGLFMAVPTDADRYYQGLKEGKLGLEAYERAEYGSAYMLTAGESLRWFRDQFCYHEVEAEKRTGVGAYHILDDEAAKIPPGSDGLIILPYFMGQRSPEFNPLARGVVFGLSMSHTRAHIYRALLEAFGYGIYHGMLTGRELPKRVVATGGGAKSELWRQIVSDIINMPQEYIARADAPLGDAYFAGYGVGIFKDIRSIKDEWLKVTAVTKPRPDLHRVYEELFKVYKSLHVLKNQYAELAEALQLVASYR